MKKVEAIHDLAHYLAQMNGRELPTSTAEAAKKVLLDMLGAMIFGNRLQEQAALAHRLAQIDPGHYRIFGTTISAGLFSSAFVNGCGSVAAEMDEGNQYSKGHPAVHVIPALLTHAQSMAACSGERFLRAVIGGYEACSRFGRATTLQPEAHAHGTWGVLGTTASVILLEAGSADDLVAGINLGASFALPTMWSSALEGALVRNAYTGHATEAGIRAYHLLRSGFAAPAGAVDHTLGKVLGRFAADKLTEDLGQGWDIEQNYFKTYAFCRYVHSPLDAMAELMARASLHADELEQIEVQTYRRAATLENQSPANVLAAKFSIPYALAVQLVSGKADHTAFSTEWFEHAQVRSLCQKVVVRYSDELERDYPAIMPAVVKVRLRDGRQYESRCDLPIGSPVKPLQLDDLVAKFTALTTGILTERQQARIVDAVQRLEQLEDVRVLLCDCFPEP